MDRYLKRAKELNHEGGVNLAYAIYDVPDAVKKYLIASYLRRMQMINGIYFFADRIKKADLACDKLECQMQIFNLSRHLMKGTRRKDSRDLIFKENLAISQMPDEELMRYWFHKTPV